MFPWANLLTLTRTLLILPIVWLVLEEMWLWASLCFTVAVVSDVYDGKVARKLKQTSPLGGLLDHGTDALFVTGGCWALAELNFINPYLCWLIPLAFLQYMLDSKALAGRTLRTSVLGKSNGVAYFALVGTVIGIQALSMFWQPFAYLLPIAQIAAWLLIATTLVSMGERALTLFRT